MRNSRRLEDLHHLAKSSLVSGRHTKFDVYSIKEDNETVIFQRFKLSHWLRGHPSNLMGISNPLLQIVFTISYILHFLLKGSV